jgi:hypothetical protein
MYQFKKNHLYQYKGGGYSGCFWEWNFFLIDDNDNFIDLKSSGIDGCSNRQQATNYFDTHKIDNTSYCKDYYVFDLKSNDSLFEFATETNKGLIAEIACKVNNHYYNTDPVNFSHRILYFICDNCNNRVYPENINDDCIFDSTEYRWEHIYCENCGYMTCDNCNCFSGYDTYNFNEYYLCKDCFEYECKDILDGNTELRMYLDYPEGQQNLFKEYHNSKKQITVTCNDENRPEILEYLKTLGFEE